LSEESARKNPEINLRTLSRNQLGNSKMDGNYNAEFFPGQTNPVSLRGKKVESNWASGYAPEKVNNTLEQSDIIGGQMDWQLGNNNKSSYHQSNLGGHSEFNYSKGKSYTIDNTFQKGQMDGLLMGSMLEPGNVHDYSMFAPNGNSKMFDGGLGISGGGRFDPGKIQNEIYQQGRMPTGQNGISGNVGSHMELIGRGAAHKPPLSKPKFTFKESEYHGGMGMGVGYSTDDEWEMATVFPEIEEHHKVNFSLAKTLQGET
jgi:hypothetical protein